MENDFAVVMLIIALASLVAGAIALLMFGDDSLEGE
jgi:hypothetical protein